MTRTEILSMSPGPDLDALVAERVMGWKAVPFKGGSQNELWQNEYGANTSWILQFNPSTSISDAWQVREEAKMWTFGKRQAFINALKAAIAVRRDFAYDVHDSELILMVEPVDICKAALIAKEGL